MKRLLRWFFRGINHTGQIECDVKAQARDITEWTVAEQEGLSDKVREHLRGQWGRKVVGETVYLWAVSSSEGAHLYGHRGPSRLLVTVNRLDYIDRKLELDAEMAQYATQ